VTKTKITSRDTGDVFLLVIFNVFQANFQAHPLAVRASEIKPCRLDAKYLGEMFARRC
jgi:hypothetical protein